MKSINTEQSAHRTENPSALENAKQTEHCMVCGETLTYHDQSVTVSCNYCSKTEHGHITCPNNHYICDQCHNQDSMQMIEELIFQSKSTNPLAIAELAMSFPALPMLGCQHAFIAGGALMAALKNEGSAQFTNDTIKEVFKRTEKQAHGGYCGLTGVCGIAPAIGACFAVLTGSKCGKANEQRTTMEAVTKVSSVITELTGPSCCKAYVRSALKVAVEFLKENFQVELSLENDTTCLYSTKHPHGCRESQCPYFSLT